MTYHPLCEEADSIPCDWCGSPAIVWRPIDRLGSGSMKPAALCYACDRQFLSDPRNREYVDREERAGWRNRETVEL